MATILKLQLGRIYPDIAFKLPPAALCSTPSHKLHTVKGVACAMRTKTHRYRRSGCMSNLTSYPCVTLRQQRDLRAQGMS